MKGVKKAVIGGALLVCGTMGASTQRLVDTIFLVEHWAVGVRTAGLVLGLSALAIAAGAVLCLLALRDRD